MEWVDQAPALGDPGRKDLGGKTNTWGIVASSHVPIVQGTSPCLPSRGFGGWPGPTQPAWSRAHTWFVRSVSRSSDTSSLLSSRRTTFCRSSSSMKPFSLKSAKRRQSVRGGGGFLNLPGVQGAMAPQSPPVPGGPRAWPSASPGQASSRGSGGAK